MQRARHENEPEFAPGPADAPRRSRPDGGRTGAGPSPVRLGPDTSCAAAFRLIARACLQQVVAGEAGVAAEDARALHRMRVGLRRLRTALSVFKAMTADTRIEAVKRELKWFARELAAARNADVFIAEVIAPLRRRKPRDADIAWLAAALERRRKDGYRQAAAAMAAPRYRALTADILNWIEAGPWSCRGDAPQRARREQPVAAFAAGELRRRFRKLKKSGRHLKTLDAESRHALRIRGKKMRYAIGFFADAFPGGKSARRRQRLLAALEALQDALGALNDVATRETLATEAALSGGEPGGRAGGEAGRGAAGWQRAFAAGRVLGAQQARVPRLLAEGARAHARLREAKPFWK
jgi:CHAD domain-containing protein